MRKKRREPEDLNMQFLDMICCGFGSMILLLMIVKVVEPVVIEKSKVNLQGIIEQRRDAVHEIRGESREMSQSLTELQAMLSRELVQLAQIQRDASSIRGQYAATKSEAEESTALSTKLASAKQSLTEEMERLLGADFRRSDSTIGGIPVDSEYIIFVIDTSGSMFNFAWPLVMQKLQETLAIYPQVKGIQVMSDEGTYMFPRYQGKWIPDSPARRKAIVERMRTWNPFSDSSPVEGIEAAIRTFWAPDKRVSVYVFGDDFQGRSIEEVVDTVDLLNRPDESGQPRVRIHGIGFPTLFQADRQDSLFRFAALMRELTYRNGGAFVGLPEFR
jgi:hypothetical protein